eukprot:TRINITY_DN18696_c0_g1_i2.p3 TRINITY_DN18696_c0_g1~~TRINITY_DN18696_c0_g1_i2.p3  ORF type:complete len:104 (+),score=27.48 TRINITY_DN18696_c0_g1_i2:54-365(+)
MYGIFFFFNDAAHTEIYTRSIVGSVRCVQETAFPEFQPSSLGTGHYSTAPQPSNLFGKSDVDHFYQGLLGTPKLMQGLFILSCLLYTSPSPRDLSTSRMPSSA